MEENERYVIYANVALILGEYDLAQDLYLKSSQPICALEMRCDIQDFLIALNLARKIDAKQEPYISKRLAF